MSATPPPDYTPIACGVHDRLESWAVTGATVEVVWEGDPKGGAARTQIADVFAEGGADWVRLGTGDVVRADRLVTVGGLEVKPSC